LAVEAPLRMALGLGNAPLRPLHVAARLLIRLSV
jgi:hypothetical protein